MAQQQKEGIPYNHHSIINAPQIGEICAPFFQKHNLNYFLYGKIYFNGTVNFLCSHENVNKFHFDNQYTVTVPPQFITKNKNTGYFLILPTHYDAIIHAYRSFFNIGHMIGLNTYHKDHIEMAYFGAPANNDHAVNFYLNNLDILERFNLDFKERTKILINESEKNKIIIPKNMRTDLDNFSSSYDPETPLKKYKLNGIYKDVYLTQRELDTIREIAKGNTAKEAAQNLQLSPRTVESYINNIKLKLDLHKTTQIINLLHQANFL